MGKDYRQAGIETYGDRCELCQFSLVEVHHIDYQEHQELENRIRATVKAKKDITSLLIEAVEKGYLEWKNNQLEKDNRSTNLAVLCGNCHTLIHRIDCGKKLLGALRPRK
jgi:predicted HNH restriction endonuclease